jgi:hypothetical protein
VFAPALSSWLSFLKPPLLGGTGLKPAAVCGAPGRSFRPGRNAKMTGFIDIDETVLAASKVGAL